jgi:uncharacterized protein (TIGR02453 family)
VTDSDDAFPGFPPDAMDFLAALKANNDRAWFAANRATYEQAIREPTEAFVAIITARLEALSASPVTAKVFRIHRDVRFSKDKSPYNAHLHIGFATGDRQSGSGFYFGLEPDRLHLGAGAFEFSGRVLDSYRAAAADEAAGPALADLLAALSRAGFRVDAPALKRVPAPYAADHPRRDLLRRKGVTAWRELTDRSLIQGPALLDEVFSAFQALAPLNQWIGEKVANPG